MNHNIIRVGLTILLLGIILIKVNLLELLNIFLSINVIFLIIALLVVVPILYIIRAYKWNIFLRSVGIKKLFPNLIQVLLIGVFYGLVTPGKIGELARVYYLNEKKSETIPTVLLEKITDILVLCVLCMISIGVFYNNHNLKSVMLIFFLFFITGVWLLANRTFTLFVTKLFKVNYDDADNYVNKLSSLFHNKCTLLKAVGLSAIYYLVAFVLGYVLLKSLNIDTSMLIALPIIILMGNIPITISGLGLRESISAACFVLLGDSGVNGVTFSLLLFSVMILFPGILGYFLTIRRDNYG
ncbi:MAG: hypothetical protein XE07_2015 [Methanothrix harundinacea]|uniref:Integral membrane protein n=1 Tax=Methanothrix harundinacea TaxID=301375 RepID=A0A101IH75_9EURY|nr:MAG: hypothetical protein XE07_2015 [Methanothrix harundinacea]